MKKTRFTESRITSTLKEYEAGKNVLDICRELKINRSTFYNWRKRYSGMDAELLRRFKELERENAELRSRAKVPARKKSAKPAASKSKAKSKAKKL